ncbi:hypothetical protein Clacol_002817 [Clathrus columnatus]|uniref:Trafficking protein particle complex subunit 11 domain-containing protein n=1 Tax=Clathrus columnatus TaxID=1419009 RepID=A0AAV5A546_9AGAM|nr:hypothetical protein Clacol_002817 [Clathrus columnatus]
MYLFNFISHIKFLTNWWNIQLHPPESKLELPLETPLQVLPNPDPLPDFDITTATTRNHVYVNRTLRYPYHQTMAHQPMHINNWIEIDKDYVWYLKEKARIIQEQGTPATAESFDISGLRCQNVIDSLPENYDACNELLEVLVDWLPKRYPTLFKRLDTGILNNLTQEIITNIENKRGVEALIAVSKLVQDDFLMARERSDGHVYFVGGLVAFPGFYLLSEKIGKSIKEVHQPVPYFNEKLLLSVERTLKRFKPHEPFERTSWEIVDDRNLFFHNIASKFMIPEKLHPKDIFFRVDHQTFRKLPRSGGIIFGVRPILKRLEDFEDSPLVPELLTRIHRESDKKLMEYKLGPLYQDKVIPYLQSLTQKQIQLGLIKGDEAIADFRALVKDIPTTQTTLSLPTESELLTNSDGKSTKPNVVEMNSYPQEFITQLLPVMFAAGLEKFASTAGSEETSEDDRVLGKQLLLDPFIVLATRLKDTLLEKSVKKGTIWMSDADRAQPSFRVIFVDKDVRFPPQKALNQEHSPLSPLTPSSPLFPDGLIAPIWTKKHTELLPSVFVLFLRLFEHPQFHNTPISPLHNQSFSEKELEKRKLDERKWDTDLSAEIGSRKRICTDRDDPNLDSRLTFIRRQSALDSRAALFVLSPVSPSELQEFSLPSHSLQAALYEPSLEHYSNHSKKARRKRNRYTGAYGTLPPSNQLSPSTFRGGPQPLRTQGWIARYEYKMGCFAEFRSEEEVARKHYQNAWEVLLEMFGSPNILPPRTKRWAEAKIIKLYLYRGEFSRAMVHFKTHLTRITDFSNGWEIGPDTWELWGWLARWYRFIAELLEIGLATSLKLPDYIPPLETVVPSSSSSQEFSIEPHYGGMNPGSVVQHPGYFYYAAAVCTQRRLEQFTLASQSVNDALSSLVNESKVDHRMVMLELYTKSYEMFKKHTSKQSQSRFTFHIAFRIASIYHDSGKYDMAVKFLERIVKSYQREQWNSILLAILRIWYNCASEMKNVGTMVTLLIEMICYDEWLNNEVDGYGRLADIIKNNPSPAPVMRLDLVETPTLFPTTLAFYEPAVATSHPSSFQIHIQFRKRIPQTLRSLLSIRIEFQSTFWMVNHRASSTPQSSDIVHFENLGLIHMQDYRELFADLNSIEDGTLVVSGCVVSDVPVVLQVSRVIYTINSPWNLEVVFGPMFPPKTNSLWLASLHPSTFIPLHRDASCLIIRRKACQIELKITHDSFAYLDERFPITITVGNLDECDINVTLDILLQPTPDESVNRIHFEAFSSTALIKGVACGTLHPGEYVQKILYIHNTGRPGERILDISVQASPICANEEGTPVAHSNETLRTVAIPTVAPFNILCDTLYRHRRRPSLLPFDLGTYTPSMVEIVCEALVKVIITNMGLSRLVIFRIDNVFDSTSSPKARLESTSMNVDEGVFPLGSFTIVDMLTPNSASMTHTQYTLGLLSVKMTILIGRSRLIDGSPGNTATTDVSIPPFAAQPDSVHAVLELPATGILHVPFIAILRILNQHPWKTFDGYFQLEPSDHFVVSGLRSGALPLVVGGCEERIPFKLIPVSCGIIQLPAFQITDRRKGPAAREQEGAVKRYPVIDGRIEERGQDVKTDNLTSDKGRIFMTIFPA